MAEFLWKSFAQPVPDKEYVAILTYLPLTDLPRFFYYTGRIQSQLKSAPGLGYSLAAHVLAKRFRTLSVLGRRDRVGAIRSSNTARQAMITLRRYMGNSAFTPWKLKGAGIPPSWREAMEGLPNPARTQTSIAPK